MNKNEPLAVGARVSLRGRVGTVDRFYREDESRGVKVVYDDGGFLFADYGSQSWEELAYAPLVDSPELGDVHFTGHNMIKEKEVRAAPKKRPSKLTQFFCGVFGHDWDCISGFEITGPPQAVRYRCLHCEKEEGL